MDLRVDWSPEAIEDVEAIAGYISRDSKFYARAVVTRIVDVSHSLGELPSVGCVVPELGGESIRERLIYSYRLVYKIERERILIVAVIHGKRSLDSILQRFTQSH